MGVEMLNANKGLVCLIEDHEDLRADLARTLRSSGYDVIDYGRAHAFLKSDLSEFAGVVVSDMVMTGMSGLECQAELSARGLTPPFVFISGESSSRQIIEAMKNHAFDFLLKPFTKSEFLGAIENAMVFALELEQTRSAQRDLECRLGLLSPREKEVFYLLAKGFSNQELVGSLLISLATAKQYKSEVMRKLCVKTLSELLVLANS